MSEINYFNFFLSLDAYLITLIISFSLGVSFFYFGRSSNKKMNLIKDLGYDTNLEQHSSTKSIKNDILKIKIDSYIYEVPNFLIFKKIPVEFNNTLIRKSLYFTRNVLQNKFFIPNNLLFPKSRIVLENYFN